MHFLIDAQLPPALARWIESQGHNAQHVAELGLDAAPDEVIWERASAIGAVIVTKDEDFARKRAVTSIGPSVVWTRLGNTRRSALLGRFAILFPQILAALLRGETLVEIR